MRIANAPVGLMVSCPSTHKLLSNPIYHLPPQTGIQTRVSADRLQNPCRHTVVVVYTNERRSRSSAVTAVLVCAERDKPWGWI